MTTAPAIPAATQAPQPASTKSVEPAKAQPKVQSKLSLPRVTAPELMPKPTSKKVSLEERIYGQIHQTQGAILPEIEAALGINRFEAVDTLRSLIKQGRVTQRNHTYLIQEEV
jgi:hypothetical protein